MTKTDSLNEHINEITRLRIETPDLGKALAEKRIRRASLTTDGRLNIISADHPARRIVQAGSNPMAMANRADYLKRVCEILIADAADGVMATMDVLEELLIVSHLIELSGGKGFVDNKVLIASLNRGGLARTAWELDDAVTGANPRTCGDWNLDGAKMLLRIDDEDANSLKTMMYCTEAINHLLYLELPMFLEPLPVVREKSGLLKVKKDAESLATIVGVASALGESSSRLWLKLPYCENFEIVAKSTTLPILMVGGESQDEKAVLKEIKTGLSKSPNVCGTMIGRNILFSNQRSHISMAEEINALVHEHIIVT
jgi:DhnA family fructose-bisphosphate aldolase class Ia